MSVRAVCLHAHTVSAELRHEFERRVTERAPAGCVLVATCHRVELYSSDATVAPSIDVPPGATVLEGDAAVRHLARVATGLESAVVAEDQVLHQLRRAVQSARAAGPLPAELDRAFDLALRAGRRARTWLPRRPGLAEVALDQLGERADWNATVLIVGAGEMGRRAARAVGARGAPVAIASRTPERAQVLARQAGARALPFDPGAAELARHSGIVVALGGEWPLSEASRAAIETSAAWVIDLSAPCALDAALRAALGSRLTTIDELAQPTAVELSARLLARLDELVSGVVAEHARWVAHDAERELAHVLSDRARAAQNAELVALWRRVPDLDEAQRAEVAQMANRLAERLLREPLEQLDGDHDGRYASAARSLFRL
jgi:glutamyl-tRNA reductase